MEKKQQKIKNTLRGIVKSARADKTAVVGVGRYIKHKKYGKYYKVSKRYTAHNPDNTYKEGDTVLITPTSPRSKRKKFCITSRV